MTASRTLLALALAVAAPSATAAPAAPDALAAAAADYRVVLDNASVRVLEHELKPGASEPMHHHPCSMYYSLAHYALHDERGDGSASDAERIPRSAWLRPAEDHAQRNDGDAPAKELIVELKQPGACAPASAAANAPLALTPSTMHWSFDAQSRVARAVLSGDPANGPFVQRLRLPAGWRLAPRTLDAPLAATVLGGELKLRIGAAAEPIVLPAGSFVTLPAGVAHEEWTDGGAEVEERGTGPLATATR